MFETVVKETHGRELHQRLVTSVTCYTALSPMQQHVPKWNKQHNKVLTLLRQLLERREVLPKDDPLSLKLVSHKSLFSADYGQIVMSSYWFAYLLIPKDPSLPLGRHHVQQIGVSNAATFMWSLTSLPPKTHGQMWLLESMNRLDTLPRRIEHDGSVAENMSNSWSKVDHWSNFFLLFSLCQHLINKHSSIDYLSSKVDVLSEI